MKKFLFIGILLIMSTLTFAQNEKCTKFVKDIIVTTNLNLETAVQTPTYTKAFFKLKVNYALQTIKDGCDSVMKSTNSGWIINSDKRDEKEYIVDGKKITVTIYWTDEYVYFSY